MAKIAKSPLVVGQFGRFLADKAMCGPPSRDGGLLHPLAVAQMRSPPWPRSLPPATPTPCLPPP